MIGYSSSKNSSNYSARRYFIDCESKDKMEQKLQAPNSRKVL
jgi:hypothetical protein